MPGKILVADDSATIQKVIKIAFSKYPVEIIDARTYYDAIKLAKLQQPMLMIVDANLPGVKNSNDFNVLQSQANQAPLLILAGSYEFVDEESLKNAGLKHFLKKPFDTNDLTTYVTDILQVKLQAPPLNIPEPPNFGNGHNVVEKAKNPFDQVESIRGQLAAWQTQNQIPITPPLPPLEVQGESPIVDFKARGKKAFEGIEETTEINLANQAEQFSNVNVNKEMLQNVLSKELVMEIIAPMIKSDLKEMIEAAVINYCKEHFAELARDVLTQELRRLADEKTKFLYDS